MPQTPAQAFTTLLLESLTLSFSGGEVELNFRAFNSTLPLLWIRSATLRHGGGIDLNYTTVVEPFSTLFLQTLAAAAAQQGAPVGEGASPRDPVLRPIIDDIVKKQVEPMVRALIIDNRHALPGIDLGELFGFGGEKGDFEPLPLPAGPNSGYG